MKKILIAVIAVILLLVSGWVALTQFLIDKAALAASLTATLEQATGRKVTLDAEAEISLFPIPAVTYHNLAIANSEGAAMATFLKSPTLRIELGWANALSGKPQPTRIVLGNAELALETLPNNRHNWQFQLQNTESGFPHYLASTPVTISDGTIRYGNAISGMELVLTAVNGTLTHDAQDGQWLFKSNLKLYGRDVASELAVKNSSVQFSASHSHVTLTMQGTVESGNAPPSFDGTVNVTAPHVWEIYSAIADMPLKAMDATNSHQPFSASGTFHLTTELLTIKAFKIATENANSIPAIKAAVNMTYAFGHSWQLAIMPEIEILDIDHLLMTYKALFEKPITATETPNPAQEEVTASSFKGHIALTADSIIYNGRSVNNVDVDISLESGSALVNHAYATFPGEASIALFGTLDTWPQNLTFDGRVEGQGQSLDQFFTFFAAKGVEIPQDADLLGRFAFRSNMAITPEQIRFSETRARVNQLGVAGAMIFWRESRLRLESYLRISDVNFDKLYATFSYLWPKGSGISEEKSNTSRENLFDVQYRNTQFNWLAGFGVDIKADIALQNYTLLERKGKYAKFQLEMGAGQMAFNDLDAEYDGTSVQGTYILNAYANQNPALNISTRISSLDLADIIPDFNRAADPKEWAILKGERLQFLPLQAYRAKVHAEIADLKAHRYLFRDMNVDITLDNGTLNLEKFDGKLWEGSVQLRAKVQTGNIPSLSASFVLGNANLVEFSEASPFLQHAAGRVGLQGQVSTTGLTLTSWFQHATGNCSMIGRDISIQGFGLSTLAQAVRVARSVPDIVSAKRAALQEGFTLFRNLSGQFNLQEGVITIPRMDFNSEEAQGHIDGQINLLAENMDISMYTVLLSTIEEDKQPPEIALRLKGTPQESEKELETQELEAYVARAAAERTLSR